MKRWKIKITFDTLGGSPELPCLITASRWMLDGWMPFKRLYSRWYKDEVNGIADMLQRLVKYEKERKKSKVMKYDPATELLEYDGSYI